MINAEYVEEALLGTLLNDPARRADVPWIEVNDFTNPLCRALWAHLEQGSPPRFSHPIDYVKLSDVLRAETDLHPRLTSPSQIAALQVHAPADPHTPAYGRILVEVAIRNQILAIGLKLGSEAERHPPQKRASPSVAIEALKELTNRWQQARPPHSISLTGLARPVNESRLPKLEAARIDNSGTEPPDRDLAAAETAILGSALHDTPKGSRVRLVALIDPCDFSDPRAVATFHAIRQLAHRGEHVDEITVLWQQTRNKSDWGPGLERIQLTRDCFTGELDPRDIETVTDAAERRALAKPASPSHPKLRTSPQIWGRPRPACLGPSTRSRESAKGSRQPIDSTWTQPRIPRGPRRSERGEGNQDVMSCASQNEVNTTILRFTLDEAQ